MFATILTSLCHGFSRLLCSLVALFGTIPTSFPQENAPAFDTTDRTPTETTITPDPTSTSTFDQEERDEQARARLRRQEECEIRESGVALELVPKHVAVIMDGNRRYGRSKYHNATRGHRDGSETLVEFAKWCCIEGVQVLTVFAFSTENWQRDPTEVAALMQLFCQYCDELRVEALQRNIRLRVLSTDEDKVRIRRKRVC